MRAAVSLHIKRVGGLYSYLACGCGFFWRAACLENNKVWVRVRGCDRYYYKIHLKKSICIVRIDI